MYEAGSRIPRGVVRHALRTRLAVFVILWLGLPLLAAIFVYGTGATTALIIYALVIAAWWTVYYSGRSWKDRDRVGALLEEQESPVVVFPARHPHSPAAWRGVRGCFVVLTDRRVLVVAYNKLLDTPIRVLWVADRSMSSVDRRADGRLLTVASRGAEMALDVGHRHREATRLFVSALGA
ncbi:hypothetical protein JL475_36845 [Streptomyces sp. M2CJ-2]|uniref:hypothetical protein n=1 Tax=Streptomyces sp. M2CJ-2 TaxID=2803948 RepID=UPI001925AB38|nr:hypothetical protein [Streptomyces sp. M2CJ-2]MBL3671374.1 hypothetical protein [Streptomyces sp. M2CJ-2]